MIPAIHEGISLLNAIIYNILYECHVLSNQQDNNDLINNQETINEGFDCIVLHLSFKPLQMESKGKSSNDAQDFPTLSMTRSGFHQNSI